MFFDFLYKPLKISVHEHRDLDKKYFTLTDEGYKYSDFYIYTVASYAKSFFKDRILALDNDEDNLQFSTLITKTIKDEEATEQNNAKYAEKFRIIDEKWQQYKENHLDEFNENERINSADDTREMIKNYFVPVMSVSLLEAVQGYLCANEILKKYGKGTDEYERLPKYTYLSSKSEFKQKHTNFRNDLRQRIGIPDAEELTVMKTETVHQLKRFKKAESVINSDEQLEEYSNQLTEFLVRS